MKKILYLIILIALVVAGAWWFTKGDNDDAMMTDETTMMDDGLMESTAGYTDYMFACSDDATLTLSMGTSTDIASVTFTRGEGNYIQEALPAVEAEAGTAYEGYGIRVAGVGTTAMVNYGETEYTCEQAGDMMFNFGE